MDIMAEEVKETQPAKETTAKKENKDDETKYNCKKQNIFIE